MRKKINKRISLITLIAFFIGILSIGIPMSTNADTSSNVSLTNSDKSKYGIAINTDGTVAIIELNNDDITAGTETEKSIGVVDSNVSDQEEVPVGTVVTLSTTTTGAAIIYTLDESEPTTESGVIYELPITIEDDVTIKACVYKESSYGEIVQFDYKVVKTEQAKQIKQNKQVEPVKTSIPEGSVTTGTSIELSTTTTGAAIYYEIEELDFIDTTTSQAIKYNKPIIIDSSKKITAYAVKEGYKDSIKSEFTYTIENQVVIQRELDDEVIAGEFSMFKMKAKNLRNEYKSVSLVIAVYDEKDRMIDYIYVSDVLKPGEMTEMEYGLRVSESGSYIKSFIIDNLNGLVPVSNTIKIPVKSKE
ncbi:chitobiase/beta-hexosaminidase C-terminal domain-containing protein [Oceanirhabdus seepicola]|uniref:Chitobiase/beta-hexosaminidase C-terminal domain-containing protein n=1 Tax=Oceanirhabdus seepicola TaxID=2828781 RepID=A0A9J6P268_9CLOT|nr:chitobiase/beta-hexosaminidase C-terminal domain-containing protein [Oceanirhabdus seepicola]MCM1990286.1 chitobiase/beta-hexosaminidase C-terminal domain-containing protein [Oceanirhabdus seepicola]